MNFFKRWLMRPDITHVFPPVVRRPRRGETYELQTDSNPFLSALTRVEVVDATWAYVLYRHLEPGLMFGSLNSVRFENFLADYERITESTT